MILYILDRSLIKTLTGLTSFVEDYQLLFLSILVKSESTAPLSYIELLLLTQGAKV